VPLVDLGTIFLQTKLTLVTVTFSLNKQLNDRGESEKGKKGARKNRGDQTEGGEAVVPPGGSKRRQERSPFGTIERG
jgi:hypothetical protein